MTFAAIRGVASAMRGAGNKAIGARLAAGVREGVVASKAGVKVPLMADEAAGAGVKQLSLFAESPMSQGDISQNLVARFTNTVTSPPVRQNAFGTLIGVGLGQNPVAALGSNVAGNYAGRVAGGLLRKFLGDDSFIANGAEGLVNFGVSMAGGNIISGMLDGGSATESESAMRAQQQQMTSQRQMPANGTMRQMADLQGSSQAMQVQGRPETPQFADQRMGGMVEIPMLDAATADKLRKRAIENAQANQFTATQLGSYMEGM